MVIDEEFKNLIPPLSADEFQQLEQNILKDGIRDSLVIWDNGDDWILIDGHNRYEIAQKHNLPYNHRRMEFPDREAAKEWIIRNQFGRRNLSAYDRSLLALKLKPMIAEKAKENQASHTEQGYQKSDKAVTTAKELAKVAGVSHDTIHKVEKIQKDASEETKQALRRGDVSINKVYGDLVAAEHENVRQKEARELREAKHRAESFGNDKVVAIGDAKQNIEDNKLIFDEVKEKLYKARAAILQVAIAFDEKSTFKAIETADRRELIREHDELQDCFRKIIKIQHKIEEVLNEK